MELDDLMKPKKKKEKIDPAPIESAFHRFKRDFKDVWAKNLQHPRSTFKYYLFSYIEKPNCIEVLRSESTIIARFFEDDCWIHERKLYDELVDALPKYRPYLRREKSFINTNWL